MYKKWLSIALLFTLFITGCNQAKLDKPDDENNEITNKINHCLSLKSSTDEFNACFEELLSINRPTRVILLALDRQVATARWLNEMSQQAQSVLKNHKIDFEAISLSEKNLIIDFPNQRIAIQALEYLNRAGIPLTQSKNQLSVSPQTMAKFYNDDTEQSIKIFDFRLKQLNLLHTTIKPYGDNYILILIPDEVENSQQEIIQQLGAVSSFEIRLAYHDTDTNALLAKGEIPQDMEVMYMQDGQPILVSKQVSITEGDLMNVYPNYSEKGAIYLGMTFNSKGTKKLYNFTKENLFKHIAFVVKKDTASEPEVLLTINMVMPIKDGRIIVSGSPELKGAVHIIDTIRSTLPQTPLTIIVNAIIK
ncbi:hypothetical protein DM558_15400 [Entomomonas moraniae]|uniref:SecDF P1 head subdomain domain-containing protein n=1 Tax=Entomomonas moraniae TaxID=2213226 RepID=A0A451EQF6_9GAMM|nr:hypothetical protein [Entomomonas moraniae]AZS52072.1 hypothetical protein DM558_15400 [Entomomonas moraniae]